MTGESLDQEPKSNVELFKLYSELAETVYSLPEGMPQLLDKIFIDDAASRGHIGHTASGEGYGVGPELTLVYGNIGARLVKELPKYLGLEDVRNECFWERFDEDQDTGFGVTYMTWDLTQFGKRINNFLRFGAKPDELTAYQAYLKLCHELARTDEQKSRVEAVFMQGEPDWAAAAIKYCHLQAKSRKYSSTIPQEFAAFFRGQAPAMNFTGIEGEYIRRYGSYDAALKAPF